MWSTPCLSLRVATEQEKKGVASLLFARKRKEKAGGLGVLAHLTQRELGSGSGDKKKAMERCGEMDGWWWSGAVSTMMVRTTCSDEPGTLFALFDLPSPFSFLFFCLSASCASAFFFFFWARDQGIWEWGHLRSEKRAGNGG